MNIVGLQVSPNIRSLSTARGIITKRGHYYKASSSPPSTPPLSPSYSPRLTPPSSSSLLENYPSTLPHNTPHPAIIKYFAIPTPTDEQLLRMRYEYMAFHRRTAHGDALAIRALGATYPIALCRDAVLNLALVYDDVGGSTLDTMQYDCRVPGVRLHSDKSLMSLQEMVFLSPCLLRHLLVCSMSEHMSATHSSLFLADQTYR